MEEFLHYVFLGVIFGFGIGGIGITILHFYFERVAKREQETALEKTFGKKSKDDIL